VFQPIENQFFRISAARAFRKPSGYEAYLHLDTDFPDLGPFQTAAEQDQFREFLARVLGNTNLKNEEMWSFEVGYLGEFLDNRLRLSLDLYFNRIYNLLYLVDEIVMTSNGLPDLDNSSVLTQNSADVLNIFGGELCLRFDISKDISLMAFWDHRQQYKNGLSISNNSFPKNIFGLGGRFQVESGLLGSLFVFTRSEFTDDEVSNPEGFGAPILTQHMDHTVTILGHIGYKHRLENGFLIFF